MYISAFICFVLLIVLILVTRFDRKVISNLRQELVEQQNYYSRISIENERLKTYMDDQHLVWHVGESEALMVNGEPDPKLVVLIGAKELYDIYHGRWKDGHESAMRACSATQFLSDMHQAELNQANDNVSHIHYSFADKKFDHDFARLVNELTGIGKKYGHTQQLRERFSHIVLEFRAYLKKKQDGEKVDYPVTFE